MTTSAISAPRSTWIDSALLALAHGLAAIVDHRVAARAARLHRHDGARDDARATAVARAHTGMMP